MTENIRELYRVTCQTWRLLEKEVYQDEGYQNINTIANYGGVLYQSTKRIANHTGISREHLWWITQHSHHDTPYSWQNKERGNMFERGIRKHQSEIKRTHCQINKIAKKRHCGRKHDGIIAHKAYINSFNVYVCKTCADWLASKGKV